jgi:hypothetical protein
MNFRRLLPALRHSAKNDMAAKDAVLGVIAAAVRAITISALSMCCSACIGDPVPERIDIVVSQAGDEISFDLPPDIPLQQRQSDVSLVELSVGRVSPENRPGFSCNIHQDVFWDIKADARRISPVLRFPLRYGETIPNAVAPVPAKKLTAGRYQFCADATLPNQRFNILGFTVLFAEFEIDRDLRLVR